MTTTFSLAEISIDLVRGTVRVGADVTWRELLAATSGLGLTGLIGSSRNSSVVQDTLGGGSSWFGRAFGPAEKNVLDVDIVGQAGRVRRISAITDPDLFRAVRSGTGNVAVVAMEMGLYPVPLLCGGRMLWSIDEAPLVLEIFADVTRQAPDELTLWAQLLRFPDLPDLPKVMRGSAFVAVDVVHLGTGADAEVQLAPFREIAGTVLDTVGPLALRDLPTVSAEPFDSVPSISFCRFLTDLNSESVTSLLTAVGPGFRSALTVLQIRHLGGALQFRPGAQDPTGTVPEAYQLSCLGVPFTPEIAADIELDLAVLTVVMSPYLSEPT